MSVTSCFSKFSKHCSERDSTGIGEIFWKYNRKVCGWCRNHLPSIHTVHMHYTSCVWKWKVCSPSIQMILGWYIVYFTVRLCDVHLWCRLCQYEKLLTTQRGRAPCRAGARFEFGGDLFTRYFQVLCPQRSFNTQMRSRRHSSGCFKNGTHLYPRPNRPI